MWTCGVRTLVGALAVVVTTAACTVSETEAPALAGPSTLATDLNIQATPDTIMWDGSSQSTVTVDARGPNNQPIRGLSIRVDMLSGGQVADFGTLSARTIVTGDDGRARAVYTAPPRPLDGADGTVLTLLFTPIGSDFRGALTRQVDIRLIPPGVILPPNGAPQPAFTFSPSAPQAFQTVLFDASGTKDEGVECGSACSYTWSFGDGGSGSGMTASHDYRAAGSVHRVAAGDRCEGPERPDLAEHHDHRRARPPTASFVYSPTAPRAGQQIFFTAEASRAATGRHIVSYDWNFGSGRTGNGVTVSKQYDQPGCLRRDADRHRRRVTAGHDFADHHRGTVRMAPCRLTVRESRN